MSGPIPIYLRAFIFDLYLAWLADARLGARLPSRDEDWATLVLAKQETGTRGIRSDELAEAINATRERHLEAAAFMTSFEQQQPYLDIAEKWLTTEARRKIQIWHSLQGGMVGLYGRRAAVLCGKPSKQAEWQRVISHSLGSIELHEEVLAAVLQHIQPAIRETSESLALLLSLSLAVSRIEQAQIQKVRMSRKADPPLTFDPSSLAQIATISAIYLQSDSSLGKWLFHAAEAKGDLSTHLSDPALPDLIVDFLEAALRQASGHDPATHEIKRLLLKPVWTQAMWLAQAWNRYQESVYIACEAITVD